ncbi:hypothetical protein RN001_011850 [Aquatica leii]|uniref:USP domain-containing protein n=1 Tax=Aquatica leii TaxID=1421715 RepID=A0AAN7SM75_9COLE|nr:hypothetical protein RN001_011850 [Aquatica leii]
MRGELLMTGDYVNRKLLNDVTSYDCNSNATYVVKKFLKPYPSALENKVCTDGCNKNNTKRLLNMIPININIITESNFKKIKESIDSALLTETICSSCTSKAEFVYTISDHIIIDTNGCGTCSLEHIPYYLTVNNKTYILRGLSHYISTNSEDLNCIGHYTAYCRRSDGFWELYNDCEKASKTISKSSEVLPHIIIYTI